MFYSEPNWKTGVYVCGVLCINFFGVWKFTYVEVGRKKKVFFWQFQSFLILFFLFYFENSHLIKLIRRYLDWESCWRWGDPYFYLVKLNRWPNVFLGISGEIVGTQPRALASLWFKSANFHRIFLKDFPTCHTEIGF